MLLSISNGLMLRSGVITNVALPKNLRESVRSLEAERPRRRFKSKRRPASRFVGDRRKLAEVARNDELESRIRVCARTRIHKTNLYATKWPDIVSEFPCDEFLPVVTICKARCVLQLRVLTSLSNRAPSIMKTT